MQNRINELLDLAETDYLNIVSKIDKYINNDECSKSLQGKITIDYLKNKIFELSRETSLEYLYPLFIMKGYAKKQALSNQNTDNFANLSTLSRVFTIMFSEIMRNAKVYYNQSSIQELFEWVYYYLYFISSNIIDHNTKTSKKSISMEYYTSATKELDKENCIYNYDLKNSYLKSHLKINHSDKLSLEKKVKNNNPYKLNNLLIGCRYDCSISNYEVVKFDVISFYKSQSKPNYNFIKHFSNNNISNSFDEKNDFTFALFERDKLFIDVWLLEYTYNVLNTFILWGHYNKLYNDLFDEKLLREFAKLNKKFNKLLTYYIADILEYSGYILPYNGQKYPTIDIKKINNINIYGDVDILAYSPITNTILNIEYKNYQMSLSNEKFYHSELKRVGDDDIFNKIEKRGNQLSENINIVKEYLSLNDKDVLHVKNYLISTRVNYSIFENNESSVNHFTSYEFIKLIENREL